MLSTEINFVGKNIWKYDQDQLITQKAKTTDARSTAWLEVLGRGKAAARKI